MMGKLVMTDTSSSDKIGESQIQVPFFQASYHGLVVGGSRFKGRGFKPQHRLLDECKLWYSYYIKKKEIKVAKWDTPIFF
jgi:hypothetical protein